MLKWSFHSETKPKLSTQINGKLYCGFGGGNISPAAQQVYNTFRPDNKRTSGAGKYGSVAH